MKRLALVKKIAVLTCMTLLALGGGGVALADEQPPDDYVLFLSSPISGTIGGVAYADEDVLRYRPTATPQWTMHFDGSVAGLPPWADIDAYSYFIGPETLESRHYMSFDTPIPIPGLGVVDDSDVVCYCGSFLTGLSWEMFFDGSDYALTTNHEDIDAISIAGVNGGWFFFSTVGSFNFPQIGDWSSIFKGSGSKVIIKTSSEFVEVSNGSDRFWTTPDDNSLKNLEFDQEYITDNFQFFMSLFRADTVNGIELATNEIQYAFEDLGEEPQYTYGKLSAGGFKKFDAFDVEIIQLR